MKLFIDRDSGTFVSSPGFRGGTPKVSFKRGDAGTLELIFYRGEVAATLANGSLIRFGIKEIGKYDGDFLVFLETWTKADELYTGKPNFNTIELNALLNHGDTDDTNDIDKKEVMMEITWSEDGINWLSSDTLTVLVHNDVIKGLEGAPIPANPAYATETALALLENKLDASIQEFSTNADKLNAISPIIGGHVLIKDEAARIERCLPLGLGLGITTAVADTRGVVGHYNRKGQNDGKPFYVKDDFSRTIIWDGSKWVITYSNGAFFESSEDVATPDLVITWSALGAAPLPIVTPDIAWMDVVGSYELKINNTLSTTVEINGVACLGSATTYVGWQNINDFIFWKTEDNYFVRAEVTHIESVAVASYDCFKTPSSAARNGHIIANLPSGKLREVTIRLN